MTTIENRIEIKPIFESFRKNGFEFIQVQRQENIAIFSKAKDNKILDFEVHVIRITPKHPHSKDPRPFVELLASNEQFGAYGWSCGTLEAAMKKFNKLTGGED